MMFLPYYLPNSTLLRSKRVGITALALWLVTQVRPIFSSLSLSTANRLKAYWLQQAFMTEFKGRSRFAPDLWLASLAFFVVNVGILGVIIDDTKTKTHSKDDAGKKKL
jgi:phosphatidylinositol glycan class M